MGNLGHVIYIVRYRPLLPHQLVKKTISDLKCDLLMDEWGNMLISFTHQLQFTLPEALANGSECSQHRDSMHTL